MKLKHLFFSSLLLSTAFVACTNDDIENLQVESKGAIALGEGFTINVSKGADSRAAFNSNYAPVWEKDDRLGAAWFHEVTKIKNGDEVETCASFSNDNFRSNHPFRLVEGAGTANAEFESNTNAFAGAYVLYYPYTDFSITKGSIPVAIPQNQTLDCAAGKEWSNVESNMFAYGVAKFVPGGKQTKDFVMGNVPVLYNVAFAVSDNEQLLGLLKDFYIEKIILEAKKDGNTVLTTAGEIVAPYGTNKITADTYNNDELPDAVFVESEEAKVQHISINLKNSEKKAYMITEQGKKTSKFKFAALPFMDEADEVTFKIVASNGYTFARTYSVDDDENGVVALINGTDKAPGAAYEGGQVEINVTIDELVDDDAVYTAEQFEAKWKNVMKSKDGGEILIGEDIVLNKALTFSRDDDKVVTVKAHCDNHSVTLTGLTVENGNIEFENPLIVKGDIVNSAYAELEAADLAAENIAVEGIARLTIREADLLKIAGTGIVELKGLKGTSGVGEIAVEKTKTNLGKLNVSNFVLNNIENKGIVTVDSGVEGVGTINNNGEFVVAGAFENKGIFNQNATLTTAESFENCAGGTLNITKENEAGSYIVIENSGAEGGKPAGVVNIELSSENLFSQWGSGSANYGTINLKKGRLSGKASSEIQKSGDLNVYKNGSLRFGDGNVEGGRIVIAELGAEIYYAGDKEYDVSSYVYFPVSVIDNDNWEDVPAWKKCMWLIVDEEVTVDETNVECISGHKLYLMNNLVLENDLEMAGCITVAENCTVKSSAGENVTWTLATNQNRINATLTLNGVDLKGKDDAELKVKNGGIVLVNNATNSFKNLSEE